MKLCSVEGEVARKGSVITCCARDAVRYVFAVQGALPDMLALAALALNAQESSLIFHLFNRDEEEVQAAWSAGSQ